MCQYIDTYNIIVIVIVLIAIIVLVVITLLRHAAKILRTLVCVSSFSHMSYAWCYNMFLCFSSLLLYMFYNTLS